MVGWGPKPYILLRCMEVVAVPEKGGRAVIQVWTWQDPVYKQALPVYKQALTRSWRACSGRTLS